MATIGSPVTEKFEIGTAEVRVGPLDSALKLTSAHSIGLIDKVMIDAAIVTAKLKGGFPQRTVAEAIVEETCAITATCREYSRRNVKLALGHGIDSVAPTDLDQAITAVTAPSSGNGGAVTVAATGFSAGMLVALYPDGQPENVILSLVTGVTGSGPYVVTLSEDFPISGDIVVGAHIMAARQVPIGGSSGVSYFTMMIIQKEFSTGRPKIFVVWKASVGSGLKWDNNATDFSSNDISFNAILPTGTDVGVGGDLEPVATLVADHPYGMFINGGD